MRKRLCQPDRHSRVSGNPESRQKPSAFIYGWYKYKEAFSADLVEYLLNRYGEPVVGRILDPFAGVGTALFAAGALGNPADGIELLPVGQEIIYSPLLAERKLTDSDIAAFDDAAADKINEIVTDIRRAKMPAALFSTKKAEQGDIRLFKGSCLNILPTLEANAYSAVITSPPYCNRYDYTRTYALELMMLGLTQSEVSELRQDMLSCTVENRKKDLLKICPNWSPFIDAANRQPLLGAVNAYLERERKAKRLNNNGIPRMARGYFLETACVIGECARVLKPGAPLFMVNDNVRYAGVSVSVDLILSDIARSLGFEVESILVAPVKKGNSSQQMGAYGRAPLRKSVCVWRKKFFKVRN